MGYLDAAKLSFERIVALTAATVRPCSEEDVQQLETRLGQPLPAAYREFLTWMGRGSGDFWVGRAAVYAELDDINQWARALVNLSGTGLALPANAFVFFWDFGQSFYFFNLSSGDDPAIYFFMDPNLEAVLREKANPADWSSTYAFCNYIFDRNRPPGFVLRSERFSDCLIAEIEEYGRLKSPID